MPEEKKEKTKIWVDKHVNNENRKTSSGVTFSGKYVAEVVKNDSTEKPSKLH